MLGACSARGRHRAGDTAIQPGSPPYHAGPGLLWLQLSLSLGPAPAANGNGRGHAAARDTGCHAGVVHGIGSHGAGALGMGVTARQCPAVITGHCHLMGEKRSHSMGQQRLCLSPVVPRAQGDVAGVALSCWTPVGGNVPIQVGDWGHHQRLGLELQSQRDAKANLTPNQGGRGMSRGEESTMAEKRALSLPSPQRPGTCAPSPGTQDWQQGSTRHVPSPLS